MNLFSNKPVLADTGAVLELRDLNEEIIKDVTITLLGKDSKVYQRILRDRKQAMLTRMQKGRKAAQLDVEKLEEDSLDDLVQLTIGWAGVKDDKGNLEFTPENVRRLYEEVPSVREQVEEFINERSNFLASA